MESGVVYPRILCILQILGEVKCSSFEDTLNLVWESEVSYKIFLKIFPEINNLPFGPKFKTLKKIWKAVFLFF